jgi:hypothetical protein
MRVFVAGLITACCVSAAADDGTFESGGALLNYLTGAGVDAELRGWYSGYAFGFIVGVADAQDGLRNPSTGYCFDKPLGLSRGQVVNVVRTYLEQRAESRHLSAESLVQAALDKAYPCTR